MPLVLTLSTTAAAPVEAAEILPESLAGKTRAEIERLPILHGNRREPLASLFRITGDAADGKVEWVGDLSGVHGIGAGMTQGILRVNGNAGRRLGAQMRGGEIHVSGRAGDDAGCEMHGGLIQILGNAGDRLGGTTPGARRGMTGGVILVGGNAGDEIGAKQRRGLICVGGEAGDFAGADMIAGTILIFGNAGRRHGAGMRRGTIGLFGEPPSELLPTFRRAARFRPVALDLVLRSLAARGFTLPADVWRMPLELYSGDLLAGGRGEILLRVQAS